MTLKQKLSLPAPQWLLFGLALLIAIGIAKVIMWLAPIIVTAAAKVIMWLAPIIVTAATKAIMWLTPILWGLVAWLATNLWQAIIWLAAAVCAYVVFEWRCKKQRDLYRDIRQGVVINAEYEIN